MEIIVHRGRHLTYVGLAMDPTAAGQREIQAPSSDEAPECTEGFADGVGDFAGRMCDLRRVFAIEERWRAWGTENAIDPGVVAARTSFLDRARKSERAPPDRLAAPAPIGAEAGRTTGAPSAGR